MESQEHIERQLDKRTNISVKDRDKSENPHSEVSDSVVDRLLLRYLFSYVSSIRRNETALAHLIMGDSLSKSFDKPRYLSRIPRFIHESSYGAFGQQFM